MSNKTTLAVIDDEPTVLSAVSLLLKALGYSVHSFNSPVEALERLNDIPDIEAVLCDLRMPHLDGFEVLKRLQEKENPLPFILMTGHGGDAEFREAYSLGAISCLRKPFTPNELKSAISQALGNQIAANANNF